MPASNDDRSLSRGQAIEQEIEALSESAIPVVIQQQTRAFDGRVLPAETCKTLLRGGSVAVRGVEACPGDGRAHHMIPERPYRDVQICIRYTGSGQGPAQQFEATEDVRTERSARQQRCRPRMAQHAATPVFEQMNDLGAPVLSLGY